MLLRLLLLSIPICLAGRFPDPPIFAAVPHYPPVCYLPPDSGLCSNSTDEALDLLTRYYFDTTTQECYPFGVQGCGGNENRFKDRSTCQKFCKLESPKK